MEGGRGLVMFRGGGRIGVGDGDGEGEVEVRSRSKDARQKPMRSRQPKINGTNSETSTIDDISTFTTQIKESAVIKEYSAHAPQLHPTQFEPPRNVFAWLLPNFLLWVETHGCGELLKGESGIGSAIVCYDGEGGVVRALYCIRVEEFGIGVGGKGGEEEGGRNVVGKGKRKGGSWAVD